MCKAAIQTGFNPEAQPTGGTHCRAAPAFVVESGRGSAIAGCASASTPVPRSGLRSCPQKSRRRLQSGSPLQTEEEQVARSKAGPRQYPLFDPGIDGSQAEPGYHHPPPGHGCQAWEKGRRQEEGRYHQRQYPPGPDPAAPSRGCNQRRMASPPPPQAINKRRTPQ